MQDKPLLDFVFAVSHPSHWHAVNMQQHPEHYSLPMRLLGSDAVAWMQEKGLGAGVWFNVEVEVNGKVRCFEGEIRDLADGPSPDSQVRHHLRRRSLPRPSRVGDALHLRSHAEARMSSPPPPRAPPHPTSQVRILHDDARVRLCNQVNLASAVRTALLLLPEEFTEVELFETIAGLSYRGDFRMAVGENPLKVRNIVHAQLDAFRSLYGGLLKSFWKSVYVIGEQPLDGTSVRIVRQDRSSKQRAEVASKLPSGLTSKLLAYYERKWNLKRALGEAGEEVELSTLDQAERWERIVLDDEFVQMLEKSAYDFVSLLRRALTGFGSQVSRRSSVDPRSTSPSRASSPLDRSSHSATSGPSFARSGEQSQRRRSRRRRRRSLDGRSTLHSFPLIPRSLPHSLYYIAVPLHFDPSQPSQSTLELVVAS